METSNARRQAMAPSHGLEGAVLACPKTQQQQQQQERKLRPHPEQALKCPRCASTNTKFCYYNNYSLSQPRYFCKGCRRYWTQGGSLRNVPVGGGYRKNKRSSSSSSKKAQKDHLSTTAPFHPALIPPPLSYDPSDLTLAFAGLPNQPQIKQFGSLGGDNGHNFLLGNNTLTDPIVPSATAPPNGFLDILRNGFVDITSSTPSCFNNSSYYGLGANGSLEMATCVISTGEEGGLQSGASATASTTTSQGSCKAMDGGDHNKVLQMMGLPWQDGSMDVGRDFWFNGVGSSWQGLINSSLL